MSLITRVLNGNLPLRISAMKTLRQVSKSQWKQLVCHWVFQRLIM